MRRPTVVYVAPQPPYPLTSGMAIRQFHLLKAYAAWARVRLVFFYGSEAELAAARSLQGLCESLHPVPVASTRRERELAALTPWRRRLLTLMTLKPRVAVLESSEELTRVVEDLAPSADLVHVGRLHMAGCVDRLLGPSGPRPVMVLDLDDVEVSLRARQLRNLPARWSRRLFGYYDLLRLWAYQARALRRFDRVLVCSARDRDRFRRSNVMVLPNGADVPEALPESQSDGRTLIFCGLLSWLPNVDGLELFVDAVLPRIRREVPDVRLVIVGKTPTPWVRSLDDGTSVMVHGDVPVVGDYYRKATVAVVPLRFAGGTRLKILEAWALGVPVVSTSIGCEGLGAVDGEHLFVADDPVLFAERCVALLRAPDLRTRFIERGRAIVAERYSWSAIEDALTADLGAIAASRRAPVAVPGAETAHG